MQTKPETTMCFCQSALVIYNTRHNYRGQYFMRIVAIEIATITHLPLSINAVGGIKDIQIHSWHVYIHIIIHVSTAKQILG